NGNVPDQAQFPVPGMAAQVEPLAEKQELAELMQPDDMDKLLLGTGQGGRFAHTNVAGPLKPAPLAVRILDGHEQSEVIEPLAVSVQKLLKGLLQPRRMPG